MWRFVLGAVGGIVLPLLCLSAKVDRAGAAMAMLIALGAGEFLERYLFFKAAPPSRMPGALR